MIIRNHLSEMIAAAARLLNTRSSVAFVARFPAATRPRS